MGVFFIKSSEPESRLIGAFFTRELCVIGLLSVVLPVLAGGFASDLLESS